MRLLLLTAMLLAASQAESAEEVFRIENASRQYDLTVEIESCGGQQQDNLPDKCSGRGRVSITRKGAGAPFQVLQLRNIEFHKDQMAYNAAVAKNARELYDDEYGFIFGDFNFDGKEDLAICNGRGGGYGAPSYSVYLFASRLKKFVKNVRLSRLTEGVYLGLFFPDAKRKRLVAFWKSGCCFHQREEYKVLNNRPVKVEQVAEAVDVTGDFVHITVRKLIHGRWVETKRREKIPKEGPNGEAQPSGE